MSDVRDQLPVLPLPLELLFSVLLEPQPHLFIIAVKTADLSLLVGLKAVVKIAVADVIHGDVQFVDGIEDPRVNEIAWLRLIEDLSFAEIAAIMGYTSRHVQRIWKPYRELWERVSREKVQTVSGSW